VCSLELSLQMEAEDSQAGLPGPRSCGSRCPAHTHPSRHGGLHKRLYSYLPTSMVNVTFISVSMYLSVHLCIYLLIYVCIYVSTDLYLYLSIYLAIIYLPIFLCLSIYLLRYCLSMQPKPEIFLPRPPECWDCLQNHFVF
jgi:hypothetical protein